MKKLKIFLPVLFLSVVTLSNAQENMSFGIKGGVNFTNLYTEDVDDNNLLFGLNAGLVAVLPFSEFLAIQPEILFSGKGAELKYNNAFVEGKAKFRLNYIEVPVLLRVNLTNRFSIQAGPYIAYLIDANIKNETNNELFDSEENLDTDDFTKFDFGLSGGTEFEFSPISIGVRYNYGLTNVGKERSIEGNTYTFPDAKNSALSVYVVLRF